MEKTEQSSFIRSLLEASLDPLVTLDIGGKITDLNTAMLNITGQTRDQLRSTDFCAYFTEPVRAKEFCCAVFEQSSISDVSLTFLHKNGQLAEVLLNASVYKGDNGDILGAVIVAQSTGQQQWATDLRRTRRELEFQNVEKEKRAAELVVANKELAFQNDEKEKRAAELGIADIELHFQNKEKEKIGIINKELEALNYKAQLASQYSLSLIEASLDPLVTVSASGKITDTNEATVNITGIERGKLIGSDFLDYFTEPQKARKVYQEVFARGSVADSPLTVRHRDGKLTDVLFNGSVYKDGHGNVAGVVIVARDVTEQKRIEKELIEARVFAELATEFSEVAKLKAEEATRIAVEAVKAKQQFLSNMSHEIRTPMNAIIGFTKVVLKTELTDKQKEYLNAIKISGDALIVLINDILDLAKVDAGKITFEQVPFRLSASISAMLHLFEPKIEEKNLELVKVYDASIPDVLLGDPVRLHQVLLNLVSNAVKFTEKGRIIMRTELLSVEGENVLIRFSVSDTGIGIPTKNLASVFENFQQASSSTSRLYGGTGLGLAIVKQLVEAQDGTVSAKSEMNVGSTFSFTLRFLKTKVKVESEAEALIIDGEIKNTRILVVEDIALNQLLMKTILDDFGFEMNIASNGKIAVEMLKDNHYDLILMDLHMPEMNGFETTEFIRTRMKLKIPIIALTADVTTVDLEKCRAVGMNDYIAKPVDERLLYTKIMNHLKKVSACKNEEETVAEINTITAKCTDLTFLLKRTKLNPKLMTEMIGLYLDQTPPVVLQMKQSLADGDWIGLHAVAHKLIPSFSIMGISPAFEDMAKTVQNYTGKKEDLTEICDLVAQLDCICTQACEELQKDLRFYRQQALN